MGSIMSSSGKPSGVSPETSTLIINRTANPLALKLGPHHNLATVARNATYALNADSNGTYQEYRLEAHANSGSGVVVVSSDECVDNRAIVIREVEGKLQVEREPRAQLPRLGSSSGADETGKKA